MCKMFDDARIIQEAIAYKDVADNYWAKSNIEQATRRGFFAGYPDGTFRPQQPIPRVQALIVLAAHLQQRIPEDPAEILRQYFDDGAEIPNYAREKLRPGLLKI